jgi:hypothetical protein
MELLAVLLGFVIGQVVKFFFEPVYRLREVIGRVDYVLGFYSSVYMNPGEESNIRLKPETSYCAPHLN